MASPRPSFFFEFKFKKNFYNLFDNKLCIAASFAIAENDGHINAGWPRRNLQAGILLTGVNFLAMHHTADPVKTAQLHILVVAGVGKLQR